MRICKTYSAPDHSACFEAVLEVSGNVEDYILHEPQVQQNIYDLFDVWFNKGDFSPLRKLLDSLGAVGVEPIVVLWKSEKE